MIVSASRRTDIPARYVDWFFWRLQEEYVLVRNPMNPRQVSRVALDPEHAEGFVFWTKNILPMLDRLNLLRDRPYYVQFTVTSYGTDVEPGIPSKGKVIVPAFQRLADLIGPARVIWRYDPILLTPVYTPEYHLRQFERLARLLCRSTETCVISFLDSYRHLTRPFQTLGLLPFPAEQQMALAGQLADIAHGFGLRVCACAEALNLTAYGIEPARCVDDRLFARLMGCEVRGKKDPGQRRECGCMASVDIGAYDCCQNGCAYCYANRSLAAVKRNLAAHDPRSPLLIGQPDPADQVTLRPMPSCRRRETQMDFSALIHPEKP